jgi:hypothetical protein
MARGTRDSDQGEVTLRDCFILMGVVRAFGGAATMSFSSVSVIANALRLRRVRL